MEDDTPTPPPAQKIPLGIRKNIRDKFEARISDLEDGFTKCLGVDNHITIEADIPQLYAYVSEQWQKESFGSLLASYLQKFLDALKSYTQNEEDAEARELLQLLVTKNRIRVMADNNISYCGIAFREGELCVLFKPDKFGYNMDEVGSEDLVLRIVDEAIEKIYPSRLPLATLRAERVHLEPKLKGVHDRLHSLFGQPIPISYNLSEMLRTLRNASNFDEMERRYYRQEGVLNKVVPTTLVLYFEYAAKGFEAAGFGSDAMLKEAWLQASPKGILFEVVTQLTSGGLYNECIFEEGYCRLRTIPKYFGVMESTIVDKAVDYL